MLKELFARQATIQAQVEKYAPTREAFEEFLKAEQGEGAGLLWWMTPDTRSSRYKCERQAVFSAGNGQRVVVEASTDSNLVQYMLGLRADDLRKAFIDVKVSLAENPTLAKNFKLPPVRAILEQSLSTFYINLGELEKDLEEIVPLVRALLPQS